MIDNKMLDQILLPLADQYELGAEVRAR